MANNTNADVQDQQADRKAKAWAIACAAIDDHWECPYNSDYKLGRIVSDALVDAGYAAQDVWVDVKDRLPDEDGLYLITTVGRSFGIDSDPFVKVEGYTKKDGGFWDCDATAWMPLPASYTPPSKEQGGSKNNGE